MSSSRQLAAIMFTDIVGYTSLMGRDEQKAFDILKQNRQLQKPIIERHHGKFLKEMGDGILASFHTVSDAVYCALEIQNNCKKNSSYKLRIGIHQGEVVFEKNDVFGDGVNIASRIQSIAPEGEIVVSESVSRDISNKKGIKVEFLKEEMLKNVDTPVKIFKVFFDDITVTEKENLFHQPSGKTAKKFSAAKRVLIGFLVIAVLIATYFLSPRLFNKKNTLAVKSTAELNMHSIAVLPFTDMSAEKDQEYLGDGIAEEIRNVLKYMMKDLKVIGRTSSNYYRDSALKTIGDRLDVKSILEGSLKKLTNQVQVTVSLINANDASIIWTKSFDKELIDIRKIQDEIATQVGEELKLTFFNTATETTAKTVNPEAYELLLKGNLSFNRGDFQKAIENYDKAILTDSAYAYPYIRKGWAIYQLTLYNVFSSKEGFSNARALLEKGLELSPSVTESQSAHHALAYISLWQYNWDMALREYEKVKISDPKPITVYAYYKAFVHNKTDEAIAIMKNVVAENPVDLLNLKDLAIHQYLGRQYDDAKKTCAKILELDPAYSEAYRINGMVYLAENKFDPALADFKKASELNNPFGPVLSIITLSRSGKKEEALKLFSMINAQKSVYVRPAAKTLIYFSLGDKQKTLEWLNQSYNERDYLLAFLRVDPIWDAIRTDTKFDQVIKNMKFPD